MKLFVCANNYTEKQHEETIKCVEVLRKLGLRDVGSNFITLKKYIIEYGLNVDHFTGKLWNKGKTEATDKRVGKLNIEDVFKVGDKVTVKVTDIDDQGRIK